MSPKAIRCRWFSRIFRSSQKSISWEVAFSSLIFSLPAIQLTNNPSLWVSLRLTNQTTLVVDISTFIVADKSPEVRNDYAIV